MKERLDTYHKKQKTYRGNGLLQQINEGVESTWNENQSED